MRDPLPEPRAEARLHHAATLLLGVILLSSCSEAPTRPAQPVDPASLSWYTEIPFSQPVWLTYLDTYADYMQSNPDVCWTLRDPQGASIDSGCGPSDEYYPPVAVGEIDVEEYGEPWEEAYVIYYEAEPEELADWVYDLSCSSGGEPSDSYFAGDTASCDLAAVDSTYGGFTNILWRFAPDEGVSSSGPLVYGPTLLSNWTPVLTESGQVQAVFTYAGFEDTAFFHLNVTPLSALRPTGISTSDWESLNRDEMLYCAAHPLQCATYIADAQSALAASNAWAADSNVFNPHNDKWDAMRHTYWASLLMYDLAGDSGSVKQWQKRHEMGSVHTEMCMDLTNNAVGRLLWSVLHGAGIDSSEASFRAAAEDSTKAWANRVPPVTTNSPFNCAILPDWDLGG